MYSLKNQVCTLEQAKELNGLGLDLNSLWRWCDWDCDKWELVSAKDATDGDGSLSAYSYAELTVFWDKFIFEYSEGIEGSFWDKLVNLPIQKNRAHNYADRIILILKLGIIDPKDLTLED